MGTVGKTSPGNPGRYGPPGKLQENNLALGLAAAGTTTVIAAAIAALGALIVLTPPAPTPAQAARAYLIHNQREVASKTANSLFPQHPDGKKIAQAIESAMNSSLIPYSCTNPTGWQRPGRTNTGNSSDLGEVSS